MNFYFIFVCHLIRFYVILLLCPPFFAIILIETSFYSGNNSFHPKKTNYFKGQAQEMFDVWSSTIRHIMKLIRVNSRLYDFGNYIQLPIKLMLKLDDRQALITMTLAYNEWVNTIFYFISFFL